MHPPTLSLMECAEDDCTMPAEIIDSVFVRTDKGGLVETLATVCLSGHRLCGIEVR